MARGEVRISPNIILLFYKLAIFFAYLIRHVNKNGARTPGRGAGGAQILSISPNLARSCRFPELRQLPGLAEFWPILVKSGQSFQIAANLAKSCQIVSYFVKSCQILSKLAQPSRIWRNPVKSWQILSDIVKTSPIASNFDQLFENYLK